MDRPVDHAFADSSKFSLDDVNHKEYGESEAQSKDGQPQERWGSSLLCAADSPDYPHYFRTLLRIDHAAFLREVVCCGDLRDQACDLGAPRH